MTRNTDERKSITEIRSKICTLYVLYSLREDVNLALTFLLTQT